MTPETILALVNFGAAGAVIIVVRVFINYLDKKDNQLSDTITKLSTSIDANTKELVQLRISTARTEEAVENTGKAIKETVRACQTTRQRKETKWN